MVRRSSTPSGDSIEVSIARLGASVSTYVLPAGATVQDALNSAGISGVNVRIGGEECAMSDVLDDGDRLIIADKVQGA